MTQKCLVNLLLILLQIPFANCAEQTMVFLGDSLTEGYGVSKEQAYPSLMQKAFPNWRFINSGVSGSTSGSGPSRMKWILQTHPQIVVLALGGNDALQGRQPAEMKKNLEETIDLATKQGVRVILIGILAPPNYGKAYTEKFSKVFVQVAQEKSLSFYPFLLNGVAGNPKLNQADAIHPNEAGHRVIAERLGKFLKTALGNDVRKK